MLENIQNIYIVGLKGAAMSNLAVILKQMGKKVSGCDVADEFITDPILRKYGIVCREGFSAQFLPSDTRLVVYSAAHGGEANPVAIEAKDKGIPIISQAKLLGSLISQFETSIAVSGCHGKTTTSSLLAYALKKLNGKPGYLIGTPFFNDLPGGGYEGENKYFVIEADEYGVNPPHDKTPKLLHLHPTHILCTNIDYDHPDVYADLEETKQTFLKFFSTGKLYLCTDDSNIRSVAAKLEKERYLSFGFSESCDLRIENVRYSQNGSVFEPRYMGKPLGTFNLALFGEKNITNAAGVILVLLDLGFQASDIAMAIRDFSSVKRRFELMYESGDTFLFDDYAHHPAEIEATIDAARSRFPHKRIVVLFQPHTYSRTLSLKKEFAKALSRSDYGLIAPIFPSARENKELFKVSSQDIEKEARECGITHVAAYGTNKELIAAMALICRKGDVLFTLGAGDVYKFKDDIIHVISKL